MKTNSYLYGDNEVPEIDPLVIARRVSLLDDMIDELNDVHYMVRDDVRINAILRAKSFWLNINKKEI